MDEQLNWADPYYDLLGYFIPYTTKTGGVLLKRVTIYRALAVLRFLRLGNSQLFRPGLQIGAVLSALSRDTGSLTGCRQCTRWKGRAEIWHALCPSRVKQPEQDVLFDLLCGCAQEPEDEIAPNVMLIIVRC